MKDDELMEVAMSRMILAVRNCDPHYGLPPIPVYLHRKTGQIVYVYEGSAWKGSPNGIDAVFSRAAIDAAPGDWLEIQRYDGPMGGEEEFVREFFVANGLDPAALLDV